MSYLGYETHHELVISGRYPTIHMDANRQTLDGLETLLSILDGEGLLNYFLPVENDPHVRFKEWGTHYDVNFTLDRVGANRLVVSFKNQTPSPFADLVFALGEKFPVKTTYTVTCTYDADIRDMSTEPSREVTRYISDDHEVLRRVFHKDSYDTEVVCEACREQLVEIEALFINDTVRDSTVEEYYCQTCLLKNATSRDLNYGLQLAALIEQPDEVIARIRNDCGALSELLPTLLSHNYVAGDSDA